MDNLTETDTKAMLKSVEDADLSTWSDDRRKDFCDTFAKRVRAARYILVHTAEILRERAESRKFISQKHHTAILKGFPRADSRTPYESGLVLSLFGDHHDLDPSAKDSYYQNRTLPTVGGREPGALRLIADQRATDILKNLPPIQKAVEIIDADTAKLMDRKEKVLVQLKKLVEELDEASEPIIMEDLDQKMTIGDFRSMVKERDKKRKALCRRVKDLNEEGAEMEKTIAKKLYSGLPGLSDAVVEAIRSHIEQAFALDEMTRRVSEQVKFGDSEAAVEMLRHFEKDEITISDGVKEKFVQALEKLKLSVKKPAATKKAAKELRA